MQMPFTASPPPLPPPRLSPSPHSPLPGLSMSTSASTSASMPRSARPYGLAHQHTHPRPATMAVQPRIIGRHAASWADVACSSPASPRTRRPSSGTPSSSSLALRAPAVQPARANAHWHPHTPSAPPPPPQPFPLPSYLDHSLLRNLLQTELPPHLHQQLVAPPPPPPPQPTHVLPAPPMRTPSPDSEDDRSPSPPLRRLPPRPQQTMIGSTPIFRLPTRWSEQDRHPYLSVSADGRDLTYNGAGYHNNQNVDAGLARANHPIPPACGIYYYEVEILSKSQKAQVSIGFTTTAPRLNKLPGWEKESWGYYGDDGQAYTIPPDKDVKVGQPFGQAFGSGDIVGAGIDFSQNRAFFTRNGMLIGHVFDTLGSKPDQTYYPSVGLRHAHEHIRANFGHAPFRYDVDEHAQGARDAVWNKIQRQSLDWQRVGATDVEGDVKMDVPAGEETAERGREELGRLVLGYLVHHGYAKSAAALQEQLARESHSTIPARPAGAGAPNSPLERRLAVLRAVLDGDIDAAVARAEAWFPSVLSAHDGRVRLRLRCRKFVELVNDAAAVKRRVDAVRDAGSGPGAGIEVDGMDVDADGRGEAEAALKRAIAYGQQLRAEYKKDQRREVQGALEQAFAVVLYHFPSEMGGEIGRWAGREGREALAAEVNEAILESQGFARHPALERAFRQAVATTVQLGYQGVGAGVYADVRRELLDG
ncbi:hypothetical protein K488DRAFT_83219 [Vararia minispora EC-137]|uniref:Uncharacterized protein n=1 Tax=Vararia minispora EC-137 TaxID=1314806 RepID=A0ACB8QV78_9AGAM|nr:hypothetical protein K488DRAFT_83219 [Vararia minispora EC-137]